MSTCQPNINLLRGENAVFCISCGDVDVSQFIWMVFMRINIIYLLHKPLIFDKVVDQSSFSEGSRDPVIV